MFLEVILKSKTRILDRLYTYFSEDPVEPGMRVIVPFGKGDKRTMALVVSTHDYLECDYTVKKISMIIDKRPILDKEFIELAFFMKKKYLSNYSSAFQVVMPPGNWQDLKEYFYVPDDDGFLKEKRTFEEIRDHLHLSYQQLNQLVDEKKVVREYNYDNQLNKKYETYVIKNEDIKGTLSSRAIAQKKVMDFLETNPCVSQKILLQKIGISSQVLKALEKKNFISLEKRQVFRQPIHKKIKQYEKIKLNDQQKIAFEKIRKIDRALLYGVTGSGKTEVYLQLVEEMLKEGKDSIVLVPEISLTPQTIQRFEGRFPGKVAVLHSKLNLNERFEQWKRIRSGHYKIVIGARSAIFAPFQSLGMIIIDEEHELSYISEVNPKYRALDIAEFRCDYHQAKLVLGSATPSVETFYAATKGRYEILTLTKRANNLEVPTSYIVDMRKELLDGNMSMFSEMLKEKVKQTLQRKEQIMLFLNKRGHTSFVFCRRCGYVLECNTCAVSMTYHKAKNRLICHMCGRTELKPQVCPNCGSKAIKEFGAGTEKLEEETKLLFPNARILRMDSDTISKKDSYEKAFEKMKRQEVDILIGTQMISKGLDFENVTLVGVMAADLSLNQGDYRAAARTYELVTQVSGRAGRGKKKGEVVIQTYKPNHFTIRCAQKNDYETFYRKEIETRLFYHYPPFYHLLNINLSHKNRMFVRNKAIELMKLLNIYFRKEKIDGLQTIGPNPSPIEKIKNQYRFDLTFKYKYDDDRVKNIVEKVVCQNDHKMDFNDIKIKIVIDPVSFY